MHKRVITALAVAGLVVLAGCAGGGTDSGGAGGDGQVTIRFGWWGNDARAATTQSVLQDFMKLHPNIKVVGEPVGTTDSYFTKLATSTAAGDAPDVMTIAGAYPREYSDRGALLDLSTQKDVLDTSKLDQSIMSSATLDGKLFGVPTGVTTTGIIANPKVFKAAGVPLPNDKTWTWDDYVKTADEITAHSPKGTYGTENNMPNLIDTYVYQRGSTFYTQGGKLAASADLLAQYWTMVLKLQAGGGLPPADLSQELANVAPEQSLMGQGKAGMTPATASLLATYDKAAGTNMVLLKAPGESEYAKPGMTLQPSQFYSVYAKSKHPKEAAMLIDYLVNSPAAGAKILNDRGVSVNPTVREAVASRLTPTDKEVSAFTARIGKEGSAAWPPPPAGSTQTKDILQTLDSSVLFHKISPQDAAQQAIQQINAALSSATS